MNDLGLDEVPRIDGVVSGMKREGATSMAERRSEEKIECKEKIRRVERKEGKWDEIVADNGSGRNTIPFIRV
jgi:hypothetical protein